MDEIVVDGREVVAMRHGVEQLLAHAHQRGRAVRRQVEAAKQLEPPRLGRAMHLGGDRVVGRVEPGRGGGTEPRAVGAVAFGQRLEEGDAGAGLELRVAHENLARERDARGLAAARQQRVAELDQARRALLRDLAPVARAIDQRAAAFRDGLQHVAEEGGVHGSPNRLAVTAH